MWIEEECYPSEPVFIASPDAVEEDDGEYFTETLEIEFLSHITLQPNTYCPLKLSRAEPSQYLDGRPPEKTRLLLLVRPAGGAHHVVCVGLNNPV